MALFAISCSRKSVAKSSPVDVYNTQKAKQNDSLIQAALKTVINQDSTCSEDAALQVILLAQRLSDCESVNADLNILLAQAPKEKIVVDKSRTKIKNSFNDVQKNNNNTTELYKLKNSLLARDSSIAELQAENAALGARLKDKTKVTAKQGSAIGDGNKIDNRKKDRFWLGVLVTLGVLYTIKTLFVFLKRYVPISIPVISFIQKFLP